MALGKVEYARMWNDNNEPSSSTALGPWQTGINVLKDMGLKERKLEAPG